VGDLDERYYYDRYVADPSPCTFRRRLGAIVLSPPHYRLDDNGRPVRLPDPKARQLRREIQDLADEFAAGTVFLDPPDVWHHDRQDACLEAQGLVLGRGPGVANAAAFKRARAAAPR